jgi:hypothetical protein
MITEAYGSGNENETFPGMLDGPEETKGTLNREEDPLKGAIVEGMQDAKFF